MNRILYDRFTSQNDTGIGAALKDSELREAVNVFFGDGSATTRPGTAPLHQAVSGVPENATLYGVYSFSGVDLFVYKAHVGGTFSLYYGRPSVIGAPPPLVLTLLKEGMSMEPRFLDLRKVMYVATGEDLYELGAYDYTAASGTVNLLEGDVVWNKPASSGGGVLYGFYRSKAARSSVALASENFSNAANWDPLESLVQEKLPASFRPVRAKDAAVKEKVKLTIGYNSVSASNVTITLNGVSKTVAVAAGDTATAVAGKIRAAAYTGWTTSGSGQTVFFEATAPGQMDDTGHEYDAGATQAYGVMSVAVQGKADDNDFARVKKCRIFLQHPKSRRIFAIGDPTDPTCVFLSGTVQYPDDMTYWSKGTQLYPTTPEAKAVALHVLTDAMLVGFSDNWYAYEGIDPAVDGTWRRLNLPIGPLSHRAVVSVPNGFIFLTTLRTLHFVSSNILNSEIILLQGQEVVEDLTSGQMETFLSRAVASSSVALSADNVDAVYHDGRVFLSFRGLQPAGTENVLVYDLARGGFSTMEGLEVNHLRSKGSVLVISGGSLPVVLAESRSKDADQRTGADVPIHTVVRSKDFDLGDDLSSKMLMDVTVMLKQYTGTDAQTADIVVLGDYAKNASEGLSLEYDQVYLDESMVWGRSWGRIWGFSEVMTLTGHPNSVSRAFGVRVESYSPIGLYGIGFGFKKLRLQGREMTSGRELIE